MKLLRLFAEHIHIGVPLEWNVFDEKGNLLLSRGYMVSGTRQLESLLLRGMFVDEVEFRRAPADHSPSKPRPGFEPFSIWSDVQVKLSLLLRENARDLEFSAKMKQMVNVVDLLCEKDADVGIFVMMQADPVKYAVLHSLHTAIVCDLLGHKLDLPKDKRDSLLGAALTMNLGMFDLQAKLAAQPSPPNPQQWTEIRAHPLRSVEILRQAGIDDPEWLRGVAEHHETPDGKGYPNGLMKISKTAELIHYADVFGAKISPRACRDALPPNRAVREMFLSLGGADNPFATVLVREVGVFPPGSFVHLENGETAIVMRRGKRANEPLVFSVCDSEGIPYIEPVRRDSARKEYSIVGVVPRQNVMVRINPAKLLGYPAQ